MARFMYKRLIKHVNYREIKQKSYGSVHLLNVSILFMLQSSRKLRDAVCCIRFRYNSKIVTATKRRRPVGHTEGLVRSLLVHSVHNWKPSFYLYKSQNVKTAFKSGYAWKISCSCGLGYTQCIPSKSTTNRNTDNSIYFT